MPHTSISSHWVMEILDRKRVTFPLPRLFITVLFCTCSCEWASQLPWTTPDCYSHWATCHYPNHDNVTTPSGFFTTSSTQNLCRSTHSDDMIIHSPFNLQSVTTLLRKVLTPPSQHRLPSSSAELFSPRSSWSRRTPPQSLHSWDSAGLFSNRQLSRPSTELIAHNSTPPCCLPVQLLPVHHELRLHIIQRFVRCYSRSSPRSLNSRPTCWQKWPRAVHARLYSMTAWCCESSCDKSSPSEPCSLILRLHCFIDVTFYSIFSLILHCFLLNFLLFLLCKLITPAPVTLWHDTPTLKFSFTFVVMTMYSFNLILDLCLLGHSILLFTATDIIRQCPCTTASIIFFTLLFTNSSPKSGQVGVSTSHLLRMRTKTAFRRTAALSRTPIFSLPSQIHHFFACSWHCSFFFYGFLGSDPGCFSFQVITQTLQHNFFRPRFVTTLDMHCLLSKFLTTLDTR